MGSLWSLITILGPILLIAAIIYAWNRNRRGRHSQVEQVERGAAKIRADIRKDPEYTED